jgi:DNA-binding MarR family transcriptional regulator
MTLPFSGSDFDPALDQRRLTGQCKAIFLHMQDTVYRSLEEISRDLGYSTASVSAQLRNLRKKEFGGCIVNKRRRPCERGHGTWEYSLVPSGNERFDTDDYDDDML